MFVIRFEIYRDEQGLLENIDFIQLMSMDEPFNFYHISEIDRANDEYMFEFLNDIDLGRASTVDMSVDFECDCDYSAYCVKIVNVVDDYPPSFFVQEIGYVWDDVQSEDEIPF